MDFNGKQPGKKTATNTGISTVRGHVRKYPDNVAIINGDITMTYSELWERVLKLSNAMLNMGMTKNDPVITYMPNTYHYIEIMLASEMTGCPITLGNYRLTGEEIAYQVNDCRAAIIFVHPDLYPAIAEIRGRLKTVKHIVVIGGEDTNESEAYETFIAKGENSEPVVDVEPEDINMLFYTSGTTGKPKGAARTMYCNYNTSISTALELGIQRSDKLLVVAPMYAAATTGYIISTVIVGGTLIIAPAFIPEESLKMIHETRPTFVFMVPVMFDWMLSLPAETIAKYDLSSVRLAVSCGAPMHTAIFQKMRDNFKNAEVINMLGCSELGFVTRISAEEWLDNGKANSIGKPIFDMELKVVSEEGAEMKPGEIGLLYARAPQTFSGYWHNPEGTKEAFLDHEWGTVGDMARMDDDGYYYLVDRAKDMILSGGTNIYPAEIETVLLQMEGIADVGVIGVPDEKWGEQVKAIVVLQKGYDLKEKEIIEFCRDKLAGFKVPKSVDYIDAIPRNPIGKMLKKDLRKKYWEGKDVFIS
ncbi:MAG TPA: AMP-binding protein [Spirochaetota bacterium]|nr:AMP-binding protein [Spirochaetota bacterium]HPJ34955.1 AMP-binding protein [Spirochaetota bacterium]